MRLKTVISAAVVMALIGVATAACGNLKPDPNSYQFVDSRADG